MRNRGTEHDLVEMMLRVMFRDPTVVLIRHSRNRPPKGKFKIPETFTCKYSDYLGTHTVDVHTNYEGVEEIYKRIFRTE